MVQLLLWFTFNIFLTCLKIAGFLLKRSIYTVWYQFLIIWTGVSLLSLNTGIGRMVSRFYAPYSGQSHILNSKNVMDQKMRTHYLLTFLMRIRIIRQIPIRVDWSRISLIWHATGFINHTSLSLNDVETYQKPLIGYRFYLYMRVTSLPLISMAWVMPLTSHFCSR